MLLIAYYLHKLKISFAWVKGHALANVIHLDDVGVIAGAYVEDTCRRAGRSTALPPHKSIFECSIKRMTAPTTVSSYISNMSTPICR